MGPEEIAALLNAKKTTNGWQANCPAHEDSQASLSISDNKDKLVMHCHAGCSFETIIAALPGEALMTESKPTIIINSVEIDGETHYLYNKPGPDGQEIILYRKVRKPGKKWSIETFEGGVKWVPGLGETERVLYNLPTILDPQRRPEPVFLCEGEKDADSLTELGLVATTNIEGAIGWKDSYTEQLRGRNIVILEDNDAAGRIRTEKLTKKLQGAGCHVKVISFPELPPKGDVTDFLNAGNDLNALLAKATEAPFDPEAPQLSLWKNAKKWVGEPVEEREQILKNLVYQGDKMVIIAPSKHRKSFFVLQMALSLATGKSFLALEAAKPCKVILVNYEITAANFHQRMVRSCTSLFLNDDSNLENLTVGNFRGCDNAIKLVEDKIDELKPDVIIFDPLYKLMDGDENQASDMKPLLKRFDTLAEKSGAAVFYVHHDAKGTAGDRSITDRGAGSGVLQRDCDATITLTQHASENKDLVVVEALSRNFAPLAPFAARFVNDVFEVAEDVDAEAKTSAHRGSKEAEAPNEEYLEAVMSRITRSMGGDLLPLGSHRGGDSEETLRGWLRDTLGLSHRKANSIVSEVENRADELGLEIISGVKGRKFVKIQDITSVIPSDDFI